MATINVETIEDVTIDPLSNNPTQFDMTSTLTLLDQGQADDDGFAISVDVQGSDLVLDRIDVALVLDTSGSTAGNSGSDFDGDGGNETILEAELIAALAVFDSYIDAGYTGDDVVFSLVTYNSDAQGRGTYTLDDRALLEAELDAIRTQGPGGGTDFDEGLEEVGISYFAAGADPNGTNIVLFLSDGFPTESSDFAIRFEVQELEDNYNAVIRGIGVGANSSLDKLQLVDNTDGGAIQVLDGVELTQAIVDPLTEADFLRFEIIVTGVDTNGDPLTQTIVLPESDPNVTSTQLGWSINQLDIDPAFVAPQDISVTVNSVFAEDPGNPGSGEQIITVQHADIPLVFCFTPGTMIKTPDGDVCVEDLEIGDMVTTLDNGAQPLRWIGRTRVPPHVLQTRPELGPVLIRQDAFGPNRPVRDMHVSRQHRIVVSDWRSDLLYGQPDGVLVPAIALVDGKKVEFATPSDGVTYIHLAFERHEVILSDGIETESFQPSHQTVAALTTAQQKELFALFPELRTTTGHKRAFISARQHIKRREGEVLTSVAKE